MVHIGFILKIYLTFIFSQSLLTFPYSGRHTLLNDKTAKNGFPLQIYSLVVGITTSSMEGTNFRIFHKSSFHYSFTSVRCGKGGGYLTKKFKINEKGGQLHQRSGR